jgi:hypothetical protein
VGSGGVRKLQKEMHDTGSVIMRLDIEAVMTRLEGAAYLYLMSVQSERSPSFKQDKKKTVHKKPNRCRC